MNTTGDREHNCKNDQKISSDDVNNKMHEAQGIRTPERRKDRGGEKLKRLIVPADSEDGYYNVKWDAPLTINTTSGKLPVEVEMTGNEGTGDITVPICTFNAAAAANIPETAFKVLRASNKFRQKAPVTKRTNGDGSVTYLATLGLFGAQFLIR